MKNFKPFTEEELEKMSLEYAKERKTKDNELKLFFNSKRFSDIISKIKTQLKFEKTLSDNSYQEPLFSDVTNLEFISVFEVLFNAEVNNTKDFKINIEENVPFYTEYIIYNGLKFSEMHGQGTAFFVEMAEDRGLDPQT